jgi:7,8-dihydropterin-6-yl-methyl-4-(beta-D-ribofuranosyl)aminobenzene 5'-phosphate synthase
MSSPLQNQTPFQAPVVDQVSVRVVVDSAYERFLPAGTHPVAKIEHVGKIPGRQMTTLACEWGLSLHLESVTKSATAQYLLDFGYTPEILNRNFDLLDINPDRLNGLILSHAHRDHYGGMEGFVDRFRHRMPDDMPFIIGGEGIFRERWTKGVGDEWVSWGALDRTALTAQNVQPVASETPHALEGAFTTGYIERTSFEQVTGGSMVASEDHFTEEERRGKLVKDDHPEEHATCYIVKGRGLVVISSCGHTGLINTIRTAMGVTNVENLHAVIGGFHLGTAKHDYIEHTVDELEQLDPDVVIPMHCSGASFIEAMSRRMPAKLVTTNVGSRFTFGV